MNREIKDAGAATELTEQPQKSVKTDSGHTLVAGDPRCLYCGDIIKKPRKRKLFCNSKHRSLYHNVKMKNAHRRFAEKIKQLLKEEGLYP